MLAKVLLDILFGVRVRSCRSLATHLQLLIIHGRHFSVIIHFNDLQIVDARRWGIVCEMAAGRTIVEPERLGERLRVVAYN